MVDTAVSSTSHLDKDVEGDLFAAICHDDLCTFPHSFLSTILCRCIGYRFARWEMLVMLATALAEVEIVRPPGYVAPRCDGSVTLHPASPVALCVRRRKAK